MSNPKLKSCPFCGTETLLHDAGEFYGNERFSAHCPECKIYISRGTEAEAVEAWNRRNSGWVPVSKKKPEKSGIYLISFGESVRESLYDVMKNKWDSGLSCEPFAWMPLPEPFEMGK